MAQILEKTAAENALLRAEIALQQQAFQEQQQALLEIQRILSAKDKTLADKDKTIADNEQTLAALEQILLLKEARIAWLERQRFSQMRERFTLADPNQLCLELGLETQQPEPAHEPAEEPEPAPAKAALKKQHPGRNPLPKELPRREIIIEPANKTDNMVRIGEEVTEKLAQVPAQLFVLRYVRPKYVTPGFDGVSIGELPETALPKSIADESLLATILIGKYLDHQPLHRQRAIYARHGVEISESTIGHWVEQCAGLLKPLYDVLVRSVSTISGYIQVDESPIPVRDTDKKGATHRGFMWLYLDPKDKLVFFDYQRSRQHKHPQQQLKDFQGILQSDGYEAYAYFDNKPGVIHLQCMAHARRKFFEAQDSDPPRARHFLAEVRKLYQIEAELRENNADYETRKAIREEKALPILQELDKWLLQQHSAVLPKSPIGKAVDYCLRRWKGLSAYVHYGIAEIDNNLVENQVRPLALGRKNYLFAGSENAAKNTAIFYSLIASAKLNGINPYKYLYNVLKKLPAHPVNRLHELLPYNFNPDQTDNNTPPQSSDDQS